MSYRFLLRVPEGSGREDCFPVSLKSGLSVEAVESAKPDRVLILSNINGNFRFLYKLLRLNRVINSRYEWTFDNGHLVLLGDCFDRTGQGVECLWLIYSLESRATRAGGRIHFILGDKDVLNMNGSWKDEHPMYAREKSSPDLGNVVLYDANHEISRWLRTKNIMERIGNILFVHGGISAEVNRWNLSLREINCIARKYYYAEKVKFEDPLPDLIYHKDKSPVWYSGYYRGNIEMLQIERTLEKFEVSTIVTGHVRAGHINSFYDGKVINGNTSKRIGLYEALLLEDDVFYRINANGLKKEIHRLHI